MSVFFGHTVPRMMDEFGRPDETAVIILKGHLLVEEHLTRVLEQQVASPEHLEKARLTFMHRLQLVRAFAPADHPTFDLMASLNSLRNHLAHSLAGEERAKRIRAFLEQYLQLDPPKEAAEIARTAREASAVATAIGHCLGFLAACEEALREKRLGAGA